MDYSKLPKLSQTPAPPPEQPMTSDEQPDSRAFCTRCGAALAEGSRFCGTCGAPIGPTVGYAQPAPADAGGMMDGWLSIGVGIVLLLIAPNFIRYLLSPDAFEKTVTITDETGSPLPYARSVFFWGDLSLTLFALVLIVEGLILSFARKAPFVAFAFGLTVLAIALNAGYIVYMMTKGYGFQFISGLATVFGVYIAVQQWALLQSLRIHVAQRA